MGQLPGTHLGRCRLLNWQMCGDVLGLAATPGSTSHCRLCQPQARVDAQLQCGAVAAVALTRTQGVLQAGTGVHTGVAYSCFFLGGEGALSPQLSHPSTACLSVILMCHTKSHRSFCCCLQSVCMCHGVY
jgi:hypothetical protein